MMRPPPRPTLFPYTTLFRSHVQSVIGGSFTFENFALGAAPGTVCPGPSGCTRSEEHTSELQSRGHLVCRLLLEKKKLVNTVCTGQSHVDPTGRRLNRKGPRF